MQIAIRSMDGFGKREPKFKLANEESGIDANLETRLLKIINGFQVEAGSKYFEYTSTKAQGLKGLPFAHLSRILKLSRTCNCVIDFHSVGVSHLGFKVLIGQGGFLVSIAVTMQVALGPIYLNDVRSLKRHGLKRPKDRPRPCQDRVLAENMRLEISNKVGSE